MRLLHGCSKLTARHLNRLYAHDVLEMKLILDVC